MKDNPVYLRIGTGYFKKVNRPLSSGDTISSLIPWSAECIRLDHSRDYLKDRVDCYDGFCFVPSHLDYQQKVGGFYNRYQPFQHVARQGDASTILRFLAHIFGEQVEMGYDYFKILLERPTQILPILCLVSEERGTGKTTFLHFVKSIFGENMTINSNEDFRSNFNIEWAQKLVIGVDETFLDRKEDSERIKNLSTAKFYKVEAKGHDRQEVEFFGKFVLCSNNEDHFIIAEPGEIRYWVRKVPPLKSENHHLLAQLRAQIPFFLHFLVSRDFVHKVPVDDLARQMLAEIKASVAKIPSGNMMLSELVGIRKRLDALSYALENPKPVTLDWKAKSYFVSLAVMLTTTAASLATVRCSNEEIEQSRQTAARYEVVQQLSPRLTRMIDQAFGQTMEPSVDSLLHAWESLDPELKKASNSRHKKR